MSDKKFAIELTEREWDHIQLAVEESVAQLVKVAADRAMDSLPYDAIARSADRFERIATKIGIRLDEEGEERMIAEWKLDDNSEVHTESSC